MSDQRFTQKARERRRRRLIRIGLGIVGAAVAGALVWLVWFSDVLAVHHVTVTGSDTLTKTQVLEVADVPEGRPLARVDLAAIESRVASLARVESVDASRSWPRTVSISVTERQSVMWARIGGQIRGIDRFGISFRTYESPPKGLLEAKIQSGDPDERLKVAQAVASVVDLISTEDPDLRDQVTLITASTKDSIELKLTKGRTVVWGSATRGERKLRVLEALLTIDASRYDVSAPDQPTTRE